MTVWITDATGREEKGRITRITDETISTLASNDVVRQFKSDEVVRVQARRSDSILNGALIGAGAAVASGLFLCSLTEPWEICRDDVGPMLRIGALGAGIGIAVDAVIRGRTVIYEAPNRGARISAQPIVGRTVGGLRVTLAF
jgi:hypothetical protein